MNKRENLLRALRRDNPEYVPVEMELCPSLLDAFEEKYGTRDFREHYDFAFRYIEPKPTKITNDYSKYYQGVEGEIEPLSWNAEWGIMGRGGSLEHFQEMLHPMQSFTEIQEIEDYP